MAVTGDILAWQPEQVALCCSAVNFLKLMINMSLAHSPLGRLLHDLLVRRGIEAHAIALTAPR